MEVVVTAGANIICAKLQSNDHRRPPTNQHPAVYSSDALHVTKTNSVKAQLQLTVIYNDGKPNSCDICSARITTNKKIHSACKSVDV